MMLPGFIIIMQEMFPVYHDISDLQNDIRDQPLAPGCFFNLSTLIYSYSVIPPDFKAGTIVYGYLR